MKLFIFVGLFLGLVLAPSNLFGADQNATFIQGKNLIESTANIATAGATTTLTSASHTNINFTGVANQTVVLPDATTLQIGRRISVNNFSTGIVTVQNSALATLGTIPSGGAASFLTQSTGSAAGVFSFEKSNITSVFGRTGIVVSANGDYTASQVTNVAAGNIAATDVQAAINELDTEKQAVGNYITALTGDVTATGPGSVAATVALVGGSTAANVNTATALIVGNKTANMVLAGPTSGGAAAATFRALVAADIPALPYASSTLTSAHIFVGDGSNVATDVAMSGDISISNTGATAYAGVVPSNKGGTGQDFSAATGIPHIAAGAFSSSPIIDADVDPTAAIALSKLAAGSINTPTYFNATGVLSPIPNWSVNSLYFGTQSNLTAHTPVDAGNVNIGIWGDHEIEITPDQNTSQFHPYGMRLDLHHDRAHTGFNTNDITGFHSTTSIEGSGTVNNATGLYWQLSLQGDSGGETSSASVLALGINVDSGYTVPSILADSLFVNLQAGSIVTNVTNFQRTSSGDMLGNFVGGIISHNTGTISGSATVLQTALSADVNGNVVMIDATDSGATATGNWNGLFLSHNTAVNSTGSDTAFTIGLSNGDTSGKSAFTIQMGSGTSNSGRIIEGNWSNGDYTNRITFNVNGGSGDIATSDTGLNWGQSSGTTNFVQAIHVQAFGTTTTEWVGAAFDGTVTAADYHPIKISPAPGSTASNNATGLDINLSQVASPNQKFAIKTTDGGISTDARYDTSVQAASPGFLQMNQLGGLFTVASGSPMTNTGVFANNLGPSAIFDDDMGPDAFGGFVGFTLNGFLNQMTVASGKTVDTYNMMLGASSIPSGSGGTITNANVFVAGGIINGGGSVTVTNMVGFHTLAPMCSLATNCWAFKDEAGAENFVSKLAIGTSTKKVSNSDVSIEIGNKKAFLQGVLTTAERNALTALEGMQIYNTTTNSPEFYNGASWVAMSASAHTDIQEIPTGVVNDVNVTYTLSQTPISNASVKVFLDGQLNYQGGGLDYTVSGTTVTMAVAPATGQTIYVVYVY